MASRRTGTASSAQHAFRLARKALLAGQRLDMQALAAELGVNRVTLYRWVGTREQLLVEVLWSLSERTIMDTWRNLAATPGPRVPEVLRRWVRATLDQPGVRQFLHGESESAMRLLTLRSGGFQPRLLALVRELITADIDEGRACTPLHVDELAYTVVRVCESYLYLPAITGEPADPDVLGRVLAVLVSAARAPT
ncbi:MAG: QsdR family transcriptional regulator [Jatrophihabitantaceae bacterium]